VAVVETSHEISEDRGLRQFAEQLGSDLGITTQHYGLPCAWRSA
jgi:hypothetical protein